MLTRGSLALTEALFELSGWPKRSTAEREVFGPTHAFGAGNIGKRRGRWLTLSARQRGKRREEGGVLILDSFDVDA